MDVLCVIKHKENEYSTEVAEEQGKFPKWKKEF